LKEIANHTTNSGQNGSKATLGRKAIALVVTAAVIIGAIGLAELSIAPKSQRTSSTGASRTCTGIPAISFEYCPSTLRISAYGEPGASPYGNSTYDGSWNFTVTISSNYVARGEPIMLTANITNTGRDFRFKTFVTPEFNPIVYAANGTQVWAWNPPSVTWTNRTISSGETISQQVAIPTSQLSVGVSYFVTVAPNSIQFPTPNNYTFTFQFSVH
jgi:hypothetical protein